MAIDIDETHLAKGVTCARECPNEERAAATDEKRSLAGSDPRRDVRTKDVRGLKDATQANQPGPLVASVAGDPDVEVAVIGPAESREALVAQDRGGTLGPAWVAVAKANRVDGDADDRESVGRHVRTVADHDRRRRPDGWGEPVWPGDTVSILILVA
jgi:hypothetical protein